MDRAALMREGWDIARMYYRCNVRPFRHPFVRDVLWDGVVDGLMEAVKLYNGRIPWRPYLLYVVRDYWRDKLRWLDRKGRREMRRAESLPADLIAREETSRIECEEIWQRARAILPPERWRELARWCHGESLADIASEMGVDRQVVHYRVNASLRQLRGSLN